MNTYKTNAELRTLLNATEVIGPGFEISIEAGRRLRFGTGKHAQTVTAHSALGFWAGFFNQRRIIDRTDGRPAQRRWVAIIAKTDDGGWVYRTTPGPKGAVRYGWAASEQDAVNEVTRWIRRRFAHVVYDGFAADAHFPLSALRQFNNRHED